MDEPTTARDDRAEPQCYQGLNEPLELALVFSFLGRWMGTGYGNGPLGPKPATGPTLAQSLCRIQSEVHTGLAPPLAPNLPKAAAPAAQFNHALQRARPSRPSCKPTPSWAGSLSLGRGQTL